MALLLSAMKQHPGRLLPAPFILLATLTLLTGCGQLGGAAAASADANAVINVATGDDLASAVRSAAPGSRIVLAPGYYPKLLINAGTNGAVVTISGPRGARIDGVGFGTKAQGWALEGMTILNTGPGLTVGVQITKASRIQLRNLLIVGTTEAQGPRDEEGVGIRAQGARAILLAGTEIRHIRTAIALMDTAGVVVSGNRFLDLREGIQISNCHGLAIRQNQFQGFQPRYDRGEHPDMIQFWTRDRPTGSSAVEIRGNLFMSGLDQSVQGIFARAEDFESGTLPLGFHRDFRIINNIYYGSSPHGISMSDVRDAVVENNTVIAAPHAFVGTQPADPTGRTGSGYVPAIMFRRSSSGVLNGNISSGLLIEPTATVRNSNNFIYTPRASADGINPGKRFAGRFEANDYPASAFAIRPDTKAGRNRQGADPAAIGPAAAETNVEKLWQEALSLAAAAPAVIGPAAETKLEKLWQKAQSLVDAAFP
jgi:hypothetical protein